MSDHRSQPMGGRRAGKHEVVDQRGIENPQSRQFRRLSFRWMIKLVQGGAVEGGEWIMTAERIIGPSHMKALGVLRYPNALYLLFDHNNFPAIAKSADYLFLLLQLVPILATGRTCLPLHFRQLSACCSEIIFCRKSPPFPRFRILKLS